MGKLFIKVHGEKSPQKPKKPLTPAQRKKRLIIIVAAEVVLLIALVIGIFIWNKFRKIEHSEVELTEETVSINTLSQETKKQMKEYTNIAFFGLDNRSNGAYSGGNSDCIMVASINDKTKDVKLISVYRDTYLTVAESASEKGDYLYSKVNSAYGRGGATKAVAALNRNLDLDIVDYVAVDFNALVEVIDELGGIELEITNQEAKVMNGQANCQDYIAEIMEVTGKKSSHVSGGLQTLDGVQATAYCRVRYTAGDDFKRTERQRTVLSKMIEKAKKADLITLNRIVDDVFDKIETSLTSAEILKLGAGLMDYELVDTHGFPFELTTGNYGSKGDLVVPTDLQSNVSELHEYFFGTKDYEPTEVVQKISKQIVSDTGETKMSATREDNPLAQEDTEESQE